MHTISFYLQYIINHKLQPIRRACFQAQSVIGVSIISIPLYRGDHSNLPGKMALAHTLEDQESGKLIS